LTNHNLCDMFYTLTKIFVYKLLLRVSQNSGHYQFILSANAPQNAPGHPREYFISPEKHKRPLPALKMPETDVATV